MEELKKENKQAFAIHNVSVRYFYNGMPVNDCCDKCSSQNINTYTSDWLRIEKMNRKECQNCGHHWLVNAR